ncbi:MAG TPA: sulfotransferase [Mycobacteriales bacterium]|nr:sulfotransferase [Mycobacteriales bacterium]
MGTGTAPRVLVLVGTDFHRFDRLVGWIDSWAADTGADVLVQFGTSRPPQVAAGLPYLDWNKLQSELAVADVVVSHGGPATISEARKAGHLPVVVPRDPTRDEHVDQHQQQFSRRLGASGLVVLAETESTLRAALAAAAATGRGPAGTVPAATAETTRRLGVLVDGLLPTPVPPPADVTRPRIAFLGGFGRSGSTLLERMLAEIPGVTAIGESVHLWERGLRDDERCGCGEPFSRCPHWQEVGRVAFGGWDTLDVEQVLALKDAVDRTRYVPRLAGPAASAKHARAVDEYCDLYRRLYRGVAEVTGDAVLVDASKHASLAFALRRAADLDLRVLHMVRDSRGVAYSWSKTVRRTEVTEGDVYMPRYSPARAALLWTANNTLFDLLGRLGTAVHRFRYEDLVASPAGVLGEVLSFLGLPADEETLRFLRSDSAELGTSHTIGGNPMRFSTGRLTLRADDAWQREMPSRARREVSALTAWPLASYGYPVRGPK